jgi:hypothetical protein
VGQWSNFPGLQLGVSNQRQGKGVFIALINRQGVGILNAFQKGSGK